MEVERNKLILSILTDILKPLGFKRKGNLFQRKTGKITSLVLLARSRFAPNYLIDVGVVHEDVPTDGLNCPILWAINSRIDDVVEDPKLTLAALNLDIPIGDEERSQILHSAFKEIEARFRNRWEKEDWLFEKATQPWDPEESLNMSFRRYVASKQRE